MHHVSVALVIAACGHGVTPPPSEPFPSERGFVDLGTHHLFYALVSADVDPASKPVFVLFNGGPGFPTSLGLLADNTGPMTVMEDGSVVPDPTTFTSIANLLYIDQRLSGFSYDDAPLESPNFDMQADALEFTRVIVRVLDAHPVIQASGVVLVGESYGGTRAQLILDDLFDYTAHPDIASEVQQHLDAIFAPAAVHDADEIATQFFGEALIQPVVLGAFQVAATMRSGQNIVDILPAEMALADPVAGAALLGGRIEDIRELSGPARHGARAPGLGEFDIVESALEARLGALDAGDLYYATGPFSTDWAMDTTVVPRAFVRNLAHVQMFVTNALDDQTVDTTSIAPALGAMGIAATITADQPAGAARPGEIAVVLPSGTATIRLPSYSAEHMVTQTQPAQFLADVSDWLAAATPAR